MHKPSLRTMQTTILRRITKMTDTELKLLAAFPRSFINCHGEFIAHGKANEYFILKSCQNDMEIKCKVLEWLSRGAYKTCPHRADWKNKEFHDFMRSGINKFLGTTFSRQDMDRIYTKLGNNVNRTLTIKFIESDYDMDILEGNKDV